MPFWKSKPKTKPVPVVSGPIGSDMMAHVESGGAKQVKRVVFAGHGSFNTQTDAKFPKVRLPPSVTMVFWCRHGEALLDAIGSYVESRQDCKDLPEYLLDRAQAEGYSRDVPEIVRGGTEIWNYRLTYPSGLSLGNKPTNVPSSMYNPAVTPSSPARIPSAVGDPRYVIMPALTGSIGDRGVPIIALLAAHWNMCDGATVHWCACRSIVAR